MSTVERCHDKHFLEMARLTLEHSKDAIYWIDSEGLICHTNKAGCQDLGYTKEELLSMTVYEIKYDFPKEEWPRLWQEIKTRKAFTFDCHHLTKSGKMFPVEISVNHIKFDNEEYSCNIVRDVSERKDSEKALENLRRQNELILESAGEGIYGLDQNGLTTFVNPAAEKMLGWKAQELLGKPQHAVIHHTYPDGSHYPREECPIYAAFKDGAVHQVATEVFWRKDGTSFPVEYVSTPIHDENDQLAGAVVTFLDITQRLKAEEALKKALTEVKQLKDRLQDENVYLQEEIKGTHNFEEIISRSNLFKKTLSKIEQVASTDATVLILGETGTGKELIARAVHHLSQQKDRPLVKVNCAALQANLIESELFGHEKGAFTGAVAQKVGRFELAHGGTIFLDEIGDLPLDLQAKLLRVLQEGEIERLGGSKTIKVNVRVIAATNRNLEEAVNKGEYRQDLYYRLNVFPIHVLPLRERKDDIALLIQHFAKKYGTKFGKQIDTIPQKTIQNFESYSWPGNVRELENLIERAVILSQEGVLKIDEPFESSTQSNSSPTELKEIEKAHLLKILKECRWVIEGPKGAAKRLGLSASTLRDRMKKHDISKPVK